MGVCAFSKTPDAYLRLWAMSSLNGISPRFGKKKLKAKSIREEVLVWGRELLSKEKTGVRFDFATESLDPSQKINKDLQTTKRNEKFKVELSAVKIKPPVDV
jgi:uncharacterized membrane-anchored protein YjiN (DUF445 family)